jgi:hypothetical protein
MKMINDDGLYSFRGTEENCKKLLSVWWITRKRFELNTITSPARYAVYHGIKGGLIRNGVCRTDGLLLLAFNF